MELGKYDMRRFKSNKYIDIVEHIEINKKNLSNLLMYVAYSH